MGFNVNSLPEIDTFTRAYVECALWASSDDSDNHGGEPLDCNYGPADITAEALQRMIDDCRSFQDANGDLPEKYLDAGYEIGGAGHDFWLTRNRHGAGFWDRGLGELGRQLTDAAHEFGECWLYVGDDGRIHIG
jgi:hypothetical protein